MTHETALRDCVAALNVAKASLWNAVKNSQPQDAYIFQAEYDQCLAAIAKAEAALAVTAPVHSHNERLRIAADTRIAALEAQLEAARKDAERGRFWLEHPSVVVDRYQDEYRVRTSVVGGMWQKSFVEALDYTISKYKKSDAALEATLTQHNNSRAGVAE